MWQRKVWEYCGVDVVKNQEHSKERSKLDGGGFRSLWDIEVYVLTGVGFLAITIGVGG